MSKNPLRKDLNRAEQVKVTKQDLKQSVSLFDIDYAMMSYLEETALPKLDDNGKSISIPVIYGNSERWKGAQRDGIFRDNKGRIQLPLMMIRRNSISKDESMPMLNRHVSYPTVTKWSKDNRYDRFSLLGSAVKPKYELYNITMPQYVEVTYQCMAWTAYTEHLNKVIEQLQFAGSFWGDKDKFKFKVTMSDFEVINEVGEGTERINRIEFTLAVKAYLLPEKFDGENTIKKSFSTKRVVMSTEVDITSGTGRLEGILSTPSPYYDNKDLIDYLSINNNLSQNPTITDTITFQNIKLIATPSTLSYVVTSGVDIDDVLYDLKLYINGVRYYDQTHFTASYSNYNLTFNFTAPFDVDSGDEIVIAGKFIELT
jgi:hypothetical protein